MDCCPPCKVRDRVLAYEYHMQDCCRSQRRRGLYGLGYSMLGMAQLRQGHPVRPCSGPERLRLSICHHQMLLLSDVRFASEGAGQGIVLRCNRQPSYLLLGASDGRSQQSIHRGAPGVSTGNLAEGTHAPHCNTRGHDGVSVAEGAYESDAGSGALFSRRRGAATHRRTHRYTTRRATATT